MNVKRLQKTLFAAFVLFGFSLHAQETADDTRHHAPADKTEYSRTSWLIYARVIRDAHGNVRVDENIVSAFRLVPWLYLEPGLRVGEADAGSYAHYKVEFRTKSFWRTIRMFVRMSDNIVAYGEPHYRRTNYLAVAESVWPLSRSFSFLAAIGNVYSRQVTNSLEAWPSLSMGAYNSYWIYKASIRYHVNDKGSVEIMAGSYDVFNPYLPSMPFVQASFDYHFTHKTALYSYFRYQYNRQQGQPVNDFLGVGVRLHPYRSRDNFGLHK